MSTKKIKISVKREIIKKTKFEFDVPSNLEDEALRSYLLNNRFFMLESEYQLDNPKNESNSSSKEDIVTFYDEKTKSGGTI